MSESTTPGTTDVPEEDRLDELYDLEEELKLIAGSDAQYATYAENAIDRLQEAGYDV